MTKYIGSQPATSFEAVKKDRFTGLTGTGVTLSHSVSSVQDIVVWVNNVKQDYNNYTVSGTALTLGGSLVSADVVQVLYVGRTFQTVNPSAASVGNNEVASTIITGQTALAATPDDTDELLISDAGTLKRIDYSFLKAANTPSFMAYLSADQTLSDNTYTKVQFNSEVFDSDNAYDNSSNYRFTAPSAGKYFVTFQILAYDSSANLLGSRVALYKNGSEAVDTITELDAGISHRFYNHSQNISVVMTLSAGDYLEVYGRGNTTDSGTFVLDGHSTSYYNYFSAYKLIGV